MDIPVVATGLSTTLAMTGRYTLGHDILFNGPQGKALQRASAVAPRSRAGIQRWPSVSPCRRRC